MKRFNKNECSDAALSPFELTSIYFPKQITNNAYSNIIVYYFRICKEFYTIRERALHQPETSEELMEMVTFIENARTIGMIKLNEKIKVYLLLLNYY